MPSEVESPMWTTARQEVRSPHAPAETPGDAPPDGGGPAPGWPASEDFRPALATGARLAEVPPGAALGGEGRVEPAAREVEPPPAARGAGTAPLRPAQATTRTPAVPVAAARPAARADEDSWVSRRGERARAQSLPRAPCRMGSSTKRQDSAAAVMVAAVCSAAGVRFSVLLAGAGRTMTGECQWEIR